MENANSESLVRTNSNLVTSEKQGAQGKTYKYLTTSGSLFFAKDTSLTSFCSSSEQSVIKAQIEFTILKIMSLLGLKVPTEIALIETTDTPTRAILIKRAIADSEQNKIISQNTENYNIDTDWYIRRAFVFKVLKITDIEFRKSHNTTKIQYKNKPGNSDRFIDYDPDLNPFAQLINPDLNLICREIYGELTALGKDLAFDQTKFDKALEKTKAYFNKNKEEIIQTINVVIKNTEIQKNILEDLQNMEKIMEKINLTKIEISPNKSCVARRVLPELDIYDFAQKFFQETHLTLKTEQNSFHYYSVSGGNKYLHQKSGEAKKLESKSQQTDIAKSLT